MITPTRSRVGTKLQQSKVSVFLQKGELFFYRNMLDPGICLIEIRQIWLHQNSIQNLRNTKSFFNSSPWVLTIQLQALGIEKKNKIVMLKNSRIFHFPDFFSISELFCTKIHLKMRWGSLLSVFCYYMSDCRQNLLWNFGKKWKKSKIRFFLTITN